MKGFITPTCVRGAGNEKRGSCRACLPRSGAEELKKSTPGCEEDSSGLGGEIIHYVQLAVILAIILCGGSSICSGGKVH
ncbi:MAG: hypothetical protein LWX01_12930 [Deltaproteobacteria bacterium]|nr:hypothetical protein [Deltaproteobacteria bacterium]MDL1962569.1 hypothetical protein [Deltaproteobacteria bacterium]